MKKPALAAAQAGLEPPNGSRLILRVHATIGAVDHKTDAGDQLVPVRADVAELPIRPQGQACIIRIVR